MLSAGIASPVERISPRVKREVQLQHFNISIMMGRPSVSQKHSSIPSITQLYCAIPSRDNICKRQLFRAVRFPFVLFAILLITVGIAKSGIPPSTRRRRRHQICNSLRNHFSLPIVIQCRFHPKNLLFAYVEMVITNHTRN